MKLFRTMCSAASRANALDHGVELYLLVARPLMHKAVGLDETEVLLAVPELP